MTNSWKQRELVFILLYAAIFYIVIIYYSLQLSHDYYNKLYGLRPGLISNHFNDASDAQWRNFRGNLPILSFVFGLFTLIANTVRACYDLKAEGMSVVWLLISLAYLSYLHGAYIFFILAIASTNFLLVKIFGRAKYFPFILWVFNLSFLLCNRVYEGYSFASFGDRWAYLDKFRGTFRCHICFNFVVLRMISFGYDFHWSDLNSYVDQELNLCLISLEIVEAHPTLHRLFFRKNMLQERSVGIDKFSYTTYLCYLLYAPLYIAGPIISFNAFASQLDTPQKSYTLKQVAWYGFRWVLSLLLMETMTHFFYYNAFAISGIWKQLSPMEVFIIGYGVRDDGYSGPPNETFRIGQSRLRLACIGLGMMWMGLKLPFIAPPKKVLNFMWLKFFLIWRYFRFWALVSGIEAPENMPRCINNCYNLESFWKNWHASFNKWLVRYMYIPLGGSGRKLLNVWVVFTFVAIWHDLEWKLLSWAWLTCIFFVPEMIVKSAATSFQADNVFKEFIFRELSAIAGAITITCLMVANLVGFVIGPSGISWLKSVFLQTEGLPTLFGLLVTFYIGTKLMFHVSDTKQRTHQS